MELPGTGYWAVYRETPRGLRSSASQVHRLVITIDQLALEHVKRHCYFCQLSILRCPLQQQGCLVDDGLTETRLRWKDGQISVLHFLILLITSSSWYVQ